MNYTKQINRLKTVQINGENIDQELMNVNNQIHELSIKRAAQIAKTISVLFIIGLALLSVII